MVKDTKAFRFVWWGLNLINWRLSFLRRTRHDPQLIYDWAIQFGPFEIRRWRTKD